MDDQLHLSKTEVRHNHGRQEAMKPTLRTIDDYLATLDVDKREALQKLRKTIKTIAPKAEECISYQMPAFRIDGKILLWMGAGSSHCAFYPGGIVEQYTEDLKGYKTSKGTIRFQPDKPIPTPLVQKLVKARIAENQKASLRRK